MNAVVLIDKSLLTRIHADLNRPHAFASERVGFLTCQSVLDGARWLSRGVAYDPVPEGAYVDVSSVGAAVKGNAFQQFQMKARREPVSMFHVHRHNHFGTPRFSPVDRQEGHRFVPDFTNARHELPHGLILLSYDSAHALVWLPETPHEASVGDVVFGG